MEKNLESFWVSHVKIYFIFRSDHSTKSNILQVLENHEKLKNTKKISTLHHLFRSEKDRISYLWKVQSNNFFILKKHGIPCWRKHFWIKRRPYFPSRKLQNFLFLLKTQNTTTPKQVTSGKTLNLILKKMLELFLKIQENIRISILDEI